LDLAAYVCEKEWNCYNCETMKEKDEEEVERILAFGL